MAKAILAARLSTLVRLSPRHLAWLLAASSLGWCLTAAAEVHPYERWAAEFGIDLNVSYDGTRVMEMKDGKFEVTERKAPGKMFTEVNIGGMTSGVILREDLGKAYILMPSMGFYREDSLNEGLMQSSNGIEFSEIEKVGKEDVNGHATTKFKTRFKDKEGKGAGFMWITDSGVPMKMDMIYSSSGEKGQRLTMQFTELNLREQDPMYFELPPNLKPMNFGNMAGFGQMGQQGATPPAAETQTAAPATNSQDDLATRQQQCLADAVKAAEEQQEQQKKKRAFGKLLGAVARTASRFGSHDLAQASHDVYAANATAADISSAAKDLGITEDEVERCRQP